MTHIQLPTIASPRFRWPIRIYWEDTDAGGVVYHSNYLKFFERARSEWLRHQGVVQTELVKLHNVVFVLRGVAMQYLKPARMDDDCEVWLAPDGLGRASLSVLQELKRVLPQTKENARGTEVLCRAHVELACVRADAFTPARIPADLYDLFALANEPTKNVFAAEQG
jgi:acyl-CoA thioester hydrolase